MVRSGGGKARGGTEAWTEGGPARGRRRPAPRFRPPARPLGSAGPLVLRLWEI